MDRSTTRRWNELVTALCQAIRSLLNAVSGLFRSTLELDTGKRVHIGPEIAQGGFSIVYEAYDANNPNPKYALKRMNVADPEFRKACIAEADVHRGIHHPNVLSLLGWHYSKSDHLCYMLFPYLPQSLRDTANVRFFGPSDRQPWPIAQALQLGYGILQGIQAMHHAQYTHRDLKLENIMLDARTQPILMDLGSAGPLYEPAATRRELLQITERASQHTTLAYRPPELLDGTLRPQAEQVLDFQKVDVWSFACTMYALLYGASPAECALRQQQIRVVECTTLSILNMHPIATTAEYPMDVNEWLRSMLVTDPNQRPTLSMVMTQIETLLRSKGAPIPVHADDEHEGDGIALLRRV